MIRKTLRQNNVILNNNICIKCGKCIDICPKDIFYKDRTEIELNNVLECIGCLSCEKTCPVNAIKVYNRKIKKILIARKCNNSCRMCFEHDVNINSDFTTSELLKEIDNTIDGNEEMIILSGAEITTRKDLFVLLERINELNKNAEIFLPTNGRMFSYDHYLEKFLSLKLANAKITISILGFKPETHDNITQVEGSYEQARKGILNLLNSEQNININFTVQKSNYTEIPAMCKYYLDKGIKSIQLAIVEPTGRAENYFVNFIPKMSDLFPHLKKSLEYGNGKVRTKNIPKCILKEFANYNFFPTLNNLKYKPEKCKNCIYDSECSGIWKKYIDIYGDSELIPIKNEDNCDLK